METADKIAQPVLVTGATGFIGRRVVHKLLQKEIDVKVLVLPNEVIPSEWAGKVKTVCGSISDPRSVEEAAAEEEAPEPVAEKTAKEKKAEVRASRGQRRHATQEERDAERKLKRAARSRTRKNRRERDAKKRGEAGPKKTVSTVEHGPGAVSYTHLRAHETPEHLVCRLLLEKKTNNTTNK